MGQSNESERAMADATATTTPRRTPRKAATAPAAKATPAKAAPAAAKAAPTPTKVDVTRFKVELEHTGTTKQYEKFAAPSEYKGVVVGNLYGPVGTERMIVMVVGAGDNGEDSE